MFSCRQLLFFEAVLLPAGNCFFPSCSTASSLEKRCFSRISDDTLGSFLTWFWHSLVLQSHGVFLPAATFFRSCSTACRQLLFFEAVLLPAVLKKVVFLGFQTTRWEFFNVVLALARPSEPWCFPAGSCFLRSCSTVSSTASSCRQQNLAKKVSFLGFQLF